MSLGAALMADLDALAAFTDGEEGLTRLYLSPAHKAAAAFVAAHMRDAGLATEIDAVGNVVGRLAGPPGAPVVMLGSHIDTVRDAGRYDGALGVMSAIAAAAELRRRGLALTRTIEVVAFGEEEGVRFPTHLFTSRALVSGVDAADLAAIDDDETSLAQALAAFGGTGDHASVRRAPGSVAAYLEVHIEQGPVLEAEGLPLGVVTSISGAARLRITLVGTAGHAGTVPMALRADALTGAAEVALAVERHARATPGLVATVGRIEAVPGSINVIAGSARVSLDIRHAHDGVRERALEAILVEAEAIAARRGLRVRVDPIVATPAVPMDDALVAHLGAAVARLGLPVRPIASGAGHDAMAMAALCPTAMLFVRCKDGISHNPAESITAEDAGLAVAALVEALRGLAY